MAGESKDGMRCTEFDGLLSEVLDGNLSGPENQPKLAAFEAHSRSCSLCGPLLAEAEAGRRWLKTLAEIEPPTRLMENILLATTGLDTYRLQAASRSGFRSPAYAESWVEQTRAWISEAARVAWAGARQPRFVLSFGMAFFSLSVSLSVAGVKVGNLRHLDLRPSAIRRSYYETSGKVVKYYENIRFVYEIESRVQEFRRANAPVPPAPEEPNKRKSNTTEHPQQNQQRNFQQEQSQPVLAGLFKGPDVVSSRDTDRRLS
jgi:hypothetical protein